MMRPTSILFFLVSLVSIKSSHGIYCLVGKGNASEVLPTDITMDQDEIKSMMKDKGVLKYGSFISRECDNSKDSALKNIEEITKNVKKKIEDGINGLQKIGKLPLGNPEIRSKETKETRRWL
ncbi:unnamed protein product [Lepeophtheirus salmonis]|uniref:(salmon louse) hypothetical protein n=1 Tax=Lepeophtheirus salmonis TaxID=72036 RepID=A0A7R8CHY9_LEPSM|nr:unnamed protein product [Lepeophtheirus salmonis]CAF2790697.1 unnamed protein product [Lepeophtheirus salmonis]